LIITENLKETAHFLSIDAGLILYYKFQTLSKDFDDKLFLDVKTLNLVYCNNHFPISLFVRSI